MIQTENIRRQYYQSAHDKRVKVYVYTHDKKVRRLSSVFVNDIGSERHPENDRKLIGLNKSNNGVSADFYDFYHLDENVAVEVLLKAAEIFKVNVNDIVLSSVAEYKTDISKTRLEDLKKRIAPIGRAYKP